MFDMMAPMNTKTAFALLLVLIPGQCSGQTTSSAGACPTVLTPSYPAPVVGTGYKAQLIATGLKSPRGIIFDQTGALLVVQSGVGIERLTFADHGGTCLVVNKTSTLISSADLNHGIELSPDGKTLYASSTEAVFSWSYDAAAGSVGGTNTTIVQNMTNDDHSTRTLLLSKKQPDLLLVSRGSASNIDDLALQESSGHSQIRAFNLTAATAGKPYDYPSQGTMLGWGLRNSVGVAEEPLQGGIYSVENSADEIQRQGTDIHTDDPGEEMNFHGYLNGSKEHQGGNYGYPNCFALWGTNIPDKGNLTVGSQFTLDPNSTLNDTTCAQQYVSPTLTFQAHQAPLDIKFTANGTLAYVTFHGSLTCRLGIVLTPTRDRTPPVGYKLSVISFANGAPTEPSNSTTAAVDILSNADLTNCPNGCFRPVGLAIDGQGRIFMSSDATGELYVVENVSGNGSSSGGNGATTTAAGPSATGSPNAAPGTLAGGSSGGALLVAGIVVVMSYVGWTLVGV